MTGSLLAFTAALARQRPVVMVLSDLHWADEAVLEVVGGLLQSMIRLPFAVLATARPALTARWSPPEGGHHSVVVHLDPLGRDTAAQLLRSLAGDRLTALDEGVADELLDRASGNPSSWRSWSPGWTGSGSTRLPDSSARGRGPARRVDTGERDVLEDAAVLGSHGRVDWLATMQRERRGSDATVHPSLSALQAKELLAVEGESWEFHSELVREVAYGTMTKQMRAKVHAGVASYLEREEFEHHEAVIDSIAHHYGRAAALSIDLGGASGTLDDTVARAVDWLRRRQAGRAGRHPAEAAVLFSEALALLDTPPMPAHCAAEAADRGRGELLLARAAAQRELRAEVIAGALTPRRRWPSPKRSPTSPRPWRPPSSSPRSPCGAATPTRPRLC